MITKKRNVELVVISDVHLGAIGCRAKELLKYLKSIDPEKIVLNGDIVDIWQFNKRFWPKTHMEIIRHFVELITSGTPVYYITGNHDETLRKFDGYQIGSLQIVNKLVLELGNKKAWFFHGDVFDVFMQYSKFLTKLGSIGYDFLIIINSMVNWISEKLGRGRVSLSKNVKNGVKSAVKYINDFEKVVVEIASKKNYDYVVCGHIHQPQLKKHKVGKKNITYLNSGDWIENLSALEYNKGKWNIYSFNDDKTAQNQIINENSPAYLKPGELFKNLQHEFLS